MLSWGCWNLIWPNTEEIYTLQFLKVSICLDKLLRIRELIGFNGYLIFNKDFVNEITFWRRHRKNLMKRMHVCNLEIRIEETTFWKARTLLKKISKYQNIKIANNSSIKSGSWPCVVTYWFEKIMDVSTFVLYFQFEIFCRSWFKFLIGNFTVVLIRKLFSG